MEDLRVVLVLRPHRSPLTSWRRLGEDLLIVAAVAAAAGIILGIQWLAPLALIGTGRLAMTVFCRRRAAGSG
jgi:hypothetical protein